MVDFNTRDIKIRFYEEKTDYERVDALLRRHGFQDISRDHLNGLALVAENGDKVVGFVWALVGESNVAYVDYLVAERIEGDTLKPNLVCCLLLPTFVLTLGELGIESFKMITVNQDRFVDETHLREFYEKYGAKYLGRQNVYQANCEKAIELAKAKLPIKEDLNGETIFKSALR